eukprot:COSAG01_NODE_4989_length_4568_cov_6.110141_5_plen_61_part_01
MRAATQGRRPDPGPRQTTAPHACDALDRAATRGKKKRNKKIKKKEDKKERRREKKRPTHLR